MDQLCQMYDQVIIDSPPVAPVTDARILGALCDETLLVLRANKSTRRLTQYAQESLASVGARIVGVVINDVPRRKNKTGYYYGYGYGYGDYQGSYRYGGEAAGSSGAHGSESNGKAVSAAGRVAD
jgi:Mrp family chromosome partitioning ATPase